MTNLVGALAVSQIQVITMLVGVDVILGIVAALLKKDFILGKLAGFMKTGVLHYIFGFAILLAVEQAFPSLAMAITIAYWLIILALVGSILDNLSKMGLSIPKMLKK